MTKCFLNMLDCISVQLCMYVSVAQMVEWYGRKIQVLDLSSKGTLVQDSSDAMFCPFVRHLIFCLVTVSTQEDNHLDDFHHNIPLLVAS